MPIELTAFSDKHLIFERFSPVVTLDEVREVNRRFIALLDASESGIYAVIDLRYVRKFPTSIGQLRDTLIYTSNPKLLWVFLIVGQNQIVRAFAIILTQIKIKNVRLRAFNDIYKATSALQSLQPNEDIRELCLAQLRKTWD
ncbi:MAG TPA: hypothetical protein VHD90_19060 [Phototrophicaceae bacterium]|nr:hypothetical protein [Phototrophicaceae bacterium]